MALNSKSILPVILLSITIALQAGSGDVFTVREKPPAEGPAITPYLSYQVNAAWRQDEERLATLRAFGTEAEFLDYQQDLYGTLADLIGGLPTRRGPLNATITGRIPMEGYTIEKLVFESHPGFRVTALVYVPDAPEGRKPAALLACGHSPIGKAYPGYQEIAVRLARRGYVVPCWDPVGQGERSQFYDLEKGDSRYNRICGEHAIMGNVAYLAGANLIRWETWDGVRALDYLLSRADVDASRISATGSSGGGTQTSFLMALDKRISSAAPSCYISSLPMLMNQRVFFDPDSDPEQNVYQMVSSGVGHAGLCLLTYPRPLVLNFAVEDFFPIEGSRKTFREVASVYRRFGHAGRIAVTEGYHGHSFSEENQLFSFGFLDRFNGLPAIDEFENVEVLSESDLQVTQSGQLAIDYPGAPDLLDLVREYYQQRKAVTENRMDELYRGNLYAGVSGWKVVPHAHGRTDDEIAWELAGSGTWEGCRIDRYLLHHSAGLSMPVLHVYPENGDNKPVALWIGERGKLTAGNWNEIRDLLDRGYQVISFDFRGQGENRMRYGVVSVDDPSLAGMGVEEQYYSQLSGVMANYVYNSLLMGRPYYLQMLEDVEIAARFAQSRLGCTTLAIRGAGWYHTVATDAAGVLPFLKLLEPAPGGRIFSWSSVVENKEEAWPIEFLLPGGAFVR